MSIARPAAEFIKDRVNLKARCLLSALDMAPPGLMVEVGCLRTQIEYTTDGWSTMYLARAAEDRGREFVSFDTNFDAVKLCNRLLSDAGLTPCVELRDGGEGLGGLNRVAFLHLDGSDDPTEALQQLLGVSLASGAVLCVDDAHYRGDNLPYGKATLIVEHLKREAVSFEIRDTEPGYSTLVAVMP